MSDESIVGRWWNEYSLPNHGRNTGLTRLVCNKANHEPSEQFFNTP
ncbi:MAG: hypothetical protein HA496_04625 [Thaumarchaeota archaeon]|nr:hypothetical protein [Nitrososphaerota archaeon]